MSRSIETRRTQSRGKVMVKKRVPQPGAAKGSAVNAVVVEAALGAGGSADPLRGCPGVCGAGAAWVRGMGLVWAE